MREVLENIAIIVSGFTLMTLIILFVTAPYWIVMLGLYAIVRLFV